jgi:uncharacterized peroxidase-related enzyme
MSPRIKLLDFDDASEGAKAILKKVGSFLGFVPNLHRLMANSPAVLTAYTGMREALGRVLDLKTREGIALAVSEANGCDYCVSAHQFLLAKGGTVDPAEASRNRQGCSEDPKRSAAITFALRVIVTSGHVEDEVLAAVRSAGFTDAEILEIAALAIHYQLTNVINNIARTPNDFPAAVLDSTEAA